MRCGFIVMHFLKRTSIHCVSGCSNCLQQQIWIYVYVFSRTSSNEVQSVVDVLNRKPSNQDVVECGVSKSNVIYIDLEALS